MELLDAPIDVHDIEYAERYLAAGDMETATPILESLVRAVEAWAKEVCVATEERQWFAFDDAFERLAYRRVEQDPRELVQVTAPLGRLYADLAFTHIRARDYEAARQALMQAVRWNPMNCSYRLDLAELFRALENPREWAALSYSVLERASDAKSAGCAYANLGQMFLDEGNVLAAAGCLRLAEGLAVAEPRVVKLRERVEGEAAEALDEAEEATIGELAQQGIPTAPSAEVAICLLMCASDAARAGDAASATNFTVRARNLIGEEAAKALVQLIHESDAELAADGKGGEA